MTLQNNEEELRELFKEAKYRAVALFKNDHDDGDTAIYQFISEIIPLVNAHSHKKLLEGKIQLIESLLLDCGNCGRRTNYLEADLRNFNTGMCAACGADALAVSFQTLTQELKELK